MDLKPLITLLAIVNPLAIVPFFIHYTQGFSREQRRHTIWVSSVSCFVVIAICALAGLHILDFFGISLASFQVGGALSDIRTAQHAVGGMAPLMALQKVVQFAQQHRGLSAGIWEQGANESRWMDYPVNEFMTVLEGEVVIVEEDRTVSIKAGESFIIPKGLRCPMELSTYFRINERNTGQFERTLIIADEGSQVHYIEGCSAPVYTNDSLHSAVVEIVVKPSARVTYTTIQNWSPNVYNLVTKRARVEAEGHMEWIDGNIGSKLTMKYPSVYLVGPKATGEVLSVAYAGPGQHQDAGAKMVHAAPETTSKIVSKSISKDGGITTYRGLVRVEEGATGCKSHVQCDALILDDKSESRTFPYMEVGERDAQIGHEATVSKIADEQLFYLMSRGLSEEQAMGMVVNGFIEPVTKTLPMEYAVEWSRLIELQMEGAVG